MNNLCPDCNVQMYEDGFKFKCKLCGLIENCTDNHKIEERGDSYSIIYSGPHKNCPQWSVPDKEKTQQSTIMRELMTYSNNHNGPSIPLHILSETTNLYNKLQINGNVWRGSVKKEILASLLEKVCNKHNIFHKKSNIAKFMQLQSDGYAKGEGILRDRIMNGDLDLELDIDIIDSIINRFLTNMGIEEKNVYINYIKDVINESITYNIGLNSVIGSKIAGVLWYLKIKNIFTFTDVDLEKYTDNIKRSTFIKFYKKIIEYEDIFEPIFHTYFQSK